MSLGEESLGLEVSLLRSDVLSSGSAAELRFDDEEDEAILISPTTYAIYKKRGVEMVVLERKDVKKERDARLIMLTGVNSGVFSGWLRGVLERIDH